TGRLGRAEGEEVDTYPIIQGDLSAGDNYDIDFVSADFEIRKAVVFGITLENASFVYDGSAHSLAISGTLPAGASASYTGNNQTDAGVYTVTANIDGGNNYENLDLTAELTITKAPLTVTADSRQGKIYGDADPIFTYAVTGFVHEDDENILTGALSRKAGEDVGTYAITWGDIHAGENYAIEFEGADFVITPAEITGITFAEGSFTYDSTPKSIYIDGKLPE